MAPTAGTRLRFKNARPKKVQLVKKSPSLKNRIRGLERFLSRGGIADTTRRAKKAELEQLKEKYEKKDQTLAEKKHAEKCKRPRFFERVKVMRKLRQTKKCIEQAHEKAEKAMYKEQFMTYREQMIYIYYYPKSESYISLYPSTPHSEEKQKRQDVLRSEAIARFEKEQPQDAFDHFCFNDDGKTKDSSATREARSAVDLLLKNPTKEMAKKQKKVRTKRDKSREKRKDIPALVDQEDDDEILETAPGEREEKVEQEEDDFFL